MLVIYMKNMSVHWLRVNQGSTSVAFVKYTIKNPNLCDQD